MMPVKSSHTIHSQYAVDSHVFINDTAHELLLYTNTYILTNMQLILMYSGQPLSVSVGAKASKSSVGRK